MDKVLLLGDIHGNKPAVRLAFQEARNNGCIAIIQLGDFGYGWKFDSDNICEFSKYVSELSTNFGIPLYWLDGNHENFDHLYELPLNDEGHRPILPGVIHLPRGSTIKFGETTFLAFGGAYTPDKPRRKLGVSYWAQETCTLEDLEKVYSAGEVDVFLSHDAPLGSQNVEKTKQFLDMAFGGDAFQLSYANQKMVREALNSSKAKKAFHGHIHRCQESWITQEEDIIYVRSLDCDGKKGNTYILDI